MVVPDDLARWVKSLAQKGLVGKHHAFDIVLDDPADGGGVGCLINHLFLPSRLTQRKG
ncbi:hypothetical protein D9M71_851920 [compost metagenome]